MGWMSTKLMLNIVYWLKTYGVYWYSPIHLQPVSYARNYCARKFLESDYTHLWFVDNDTIPPPFAYDLLTRANVPVISGIAHVMKEDLDGVVKRVAMVARKDEKGEYKEARGQGIAPVDRCGSACVLIQRQVFERVEFPYYNEGSWGGVRGEDFNFIDKVRAAEIDVYAHHDVVCTHLKYVEI
jgi:hypothetical protein